MEIISTKILLTIAIILGAYAIIQKQIRKKQTNENQVKKEYLKILNSEEYRVK